MENSSPVGSVELEAPSSSNSCTPSTVVNGDALVNTSEQDDVFVVDPEFGVAINEEIPVSTTNSFAYKPRSRSGTLDENGEGNPTPPAGRSRSGTMMSGKSDGLLAGTQFSFPVDCGTETTAVRDRSGTIGEMPSSSDNNKFHVCCHKYFTYFKYILSSLLTLAYVAYIMWGIWTNQAVLPGHPVAHFVIFIFCMTLVAYLEGLQVAILANEKESPEKRKLTHPRGYKLMKSVREGNNVERFLVGRQFFTIFVMTLMAQVTSFPGISHLGIPSVVWFIFIQTGLPGAMVVATIGSLQPQLLAAKDPWQFLNLYGSYFVLQLCYALESTGICTHFSWLLISFFRKTIYITKNRPKQHKDDLTKGWALVKEVLKYFASTCVLLTYVSYLMWGIWTGQAILPIPHIAVFCTLFLCFFCLSLLEGLQVAILVAETNDPEPYKEASPRAYSLMKRATFEKNVRRFLIGRQFFLVFVVFLVNQCTIFPGISHLGINNGVWFVFIQLGLPTALTVLCFAQLPAQLLANQDAVMFMNRFGSRFFLEVCLFTEKTGLAHFSWVVTSFSKATWFPINVTMLDEISQFKDLEAMKKTKPRFNNEYSVTASCDDVSGLTRNGDASTQSGCCGEGSGGGGKDSIQTSTTKVEPALGGNFDIDVGSSSSSSSSSMNSNTLLKTEELELEMHSDISHVLVQDPPDEV